MLIELQHISKYYEQPGSNIKNLVLNNISFSISEGESIAIVGPSGSGKSTLLNIIGTLDKPSTGKVIFNGYDIGNQSDDKLAEIRNLQIGYVFQLHHLLPQLTLIENILLPLLPVKDKIKKKEAEERANFLIERIGLKDRMFNRPAQLSGGECQRVAVIRALINQPKLLLADEPTGSLDAENAIHLGKLLKEFNHEQQIAMLVVTHSQELASQMDKVYKLNSGKLEKQ